MAFKDYFAAIVQKWLIEWQEQKQMPRVTLLGLPGRASGGVAL